MGSVRKTSLAGVLVVGFLAGVITGPLLLRTVTADMQGHSGRSGDAGCHAMMENMDPGAMSQMCAAMMEDMDPEAMARMCAAMMEDMDGGMMEGMMGGMGRGSMGR